MLRSLLPHCFVEDGGDDATVRMRRRPFETVGQGELADEAVVVFVEMEFQTESALVRRSAAKTIVAVDLFLNLVAGDGFVASHNSKMKHRGRRAQASFGGVRHGGAQNRGLPDLFALCPLYLSGKAVVSEQAGVMRITRIDIDLDVFLPASIPTGLL